MFEEITMRKSKSQRTVERLLPDNPEAWPNYVKYTVAFNEDLRQRCREKLAQARADLEAERESNPDLVRYHAFEVWYLQTEIDNCTGIILRLTALPPGPQWINAEPLRRLPEPRKRRKEPG